VRLDPLVLWAPPLWTRLLAAAAAVGGGRIVGVGVVRTATQLSADKETVPIDGRGFGYAGRSSTPRRRRSAICRQIHPPHQHWHREQWISEEEAAARRRIRRSNGAFGATRSNWH